MATSQSIVAPSAHQEDSSVEYRDLPGFPGYRVGNDGTVLTCRRTRAGMTGAWRLMAGGEWRNGRMMLTLRQDGKSVRKQLHHAVLEAFIGPRPPGMVCCHLDDNPKNNRLSNLRWDTPESNYRDRDRNQRTARGERQGMSKLTAAQVVEMRELAVQGWDNQQLAARFGCNDSNVSNIVTGKTWNHVGGPRVLVMTRGGVVQRRELLPVKMAINR